MHREQVNIIRIGDQLQYFREYQRKLRALIGEEQATQRVNQALVLITLGGNDFVNNYYLVPMSVRSRQYALPDYVRFIVSEYRKILLVRRRSCRIHSGTRARHVRRRTASISSPGESHLYVCSAERRHRPGTSD
jgi:hypothetical protein